MGPNMPDGRGFLGWGPLGQKGRADFPRFVARLTDVAKSADHQLASLADYRKPVG